MRWLVLLVLGLLLVPTVSALVLPGSETRQVLLTLEASELSPDQVAALEALGIQVLETFEVSRTARALVPATAVDDLAALPFVASVQDDEPVQPLLASSRSATGMSKALYAAGLTGSGVTIALVDSGIDQHHPGLRDRVVADLGVSEDGIRKDAPSSSDHGTHVAGILVGTGAGARSGQDLRGMAPGADLVSLDLSTQFTTSNALRAFEWIYQNHEEHNIQVVANSWGRQRDQASYDPGDPIVRATNALVEQGLVVVFSAGNGGDQPGRMTVEATNPNVITVGAVTDEGRVEAYSSRGPVLEGGQRASWLKPDIVAPGSRVVSTMDTTAGGKPYRMMNGTSMAAPHAAGAAALLLSVRPDLTPGQVKGLLQESARDVAAPGPDDQSGYGMLDIRAALALLENTSARTVTHRDVVAEDQGELETEPTSRGLLQLSSLEAKETIPFQVQQNATGLEVTLTWSGSSELEARLVGPSGPVRRATVHDERSISLADPEPGDWRLELSAEGLRGGTYDAQMAVTWEETRAGTGLPVDAMVRPNSGGGFPSLSTPSPFGPSLIPGVPNIVPVIGGTVVSLVLVVGRFAGWKP